MNSNKKIIIFLTILVVFILVSIVLMSVLLFGKIQKESDNLVFQKKRLLELEMKIKNLKDFQAVYDDYQINFKKIDNLFINSAEPIDFIEFLEQEAENSNLFIEITPFQEEEGDLWPTMNFQLTSAGSFNDFLEFFEKLESSPYLIEVLSLRIRESTKGDERSVDAGLSEEDVIAALLIRVCAE
ncbi:MAG: type 4a pilus biogenesis protein PilO [Candidatus Nealsonbacteria bacterium]